MSLNIFFDPVDEALEEGIRDPQAVFQHVTPNRALAFPSWSDADLAVVGLTEARGGAQPGVAKGADAVRRAWYRLKKGTGRYRIVDLGNLRNGRTVAETRERLRVVTETLLQKNVTVLLLGGTHDLHIGTLPALETLDGRVSVAHVDARLDAEAVSLTDPREHHLSSLIERVPKHVFNLVHLGHQTYWADPAVRARFEKAPFDVMRLGLLRDCLADAEPLLRECAAVHFDTAALRRQDAPGAVGGGPFGLTAEEACQLSWYAGCSPATRLVGWHEYDPEQEAVPHTAEVLAVLVWYFTEGFYHRRPAAPLTRFEVPLEDEALVFYCNDAADRWWLEVPQPKGDSPPLRVACRYADYLAATQGEIPDRWLNTLARLA